MERYSLEITEPAKKQLIQIYKSGDQKSIKRLNRIFEELTEHPYTGFASPEPLKHSLSGYWSREINKKDRLVYRVDEKIVTVYILSVSGHYGDK